MMPTWVSPKVSPCASWTIARTASGGSCAVITQRATALSAAITTSIDGCSVNRGDSANSTISAITPSDPQPGNRQSAEARLLPGDRREDVIGGMAALDQRRRHDDGEKAAVAQQRARAAGARAGRPGVVQRLQREAGQRPERGRAGDDPDQVSGGDEVDQQPADQRADDEGGRAPQPQRSVVEAIALHAPQRIGVRQRHHRRPQAAGQRRRSGTPAAADAGCRAWKSPARWQRRSR